MVLLLDCYSYNNSTKMFRYLIQAAKVQYSHALWNRPL